MSIKRINIAMQAKAIRAEVIKNHMHENGYKRCVCFSCGNATRMLKAAGVDCVAVAPNGDLNACRWWSMEEIKQVFNGCFDATSGHLSTEVMQKLAKAYKGAFAPCFKAGATYEIPTGSGETILCLKLAFPNTNFIACWDNNQPACAYESAAPLVPVIKALFSYNILPKEASDER